LKTEKRLRDLQDVKPAYPRVDALREPVKDTYQSRPTAAFDRTARVQVCGRRGHRIARPNSFVNVGELQFSRKRNCEPEKRGVAWGRLVSDWITEICPPLRLVAPALDMPYRATVVICRYIFEGRISVIPYARPNLSHMKIRGELSAFAPRCAIAGG
jgi:hypothetical protein